MIETFISYLEVCVTCKVWTQTTINMLKSEFVVAFRQGLYVAQSGLNFTIYPWLPEYHLSSSERTGMCFNFGE